MIYRAKLTDVLIPKDWGFQNNGRQP